MIGAVLAVVLVLGVVGALVAFATIGGSRNDASTSEGTTPSFTYSPTPSSESLVPTTTSRSPVTRDTEPSTAPPTTTGSAGPRAVAATSDNPIFADHNASLPNITCSFPQWTATVDAATSFFRGARTCLDREWQPTLAAANLPFSSPDISVPARGADATSPCSGDMSNYAAFYCPANHTIYMPLDKIQTNLYGDKWYVYLQVFAHEYGHHVQALSGITRKESSEMNAAGTDSDQGLEPSRRFELEAQCFSGMFIGAATYAGDLTHAQADFLAKDQYTRGDDSQRVDMHNHGLSQHYGDWFAKIGMPSDRTWKCNTWSAPSGDVS
ncbi:putative metalloprotease [Nocardia sp. GAS34]|uniref:neutral zinc metallopeptidase n=1 Tax=unclassified Nocardia TaxID=2637762 RepID=UPI003D191F9B